MQNPMLNLLNQQTRNSNQNNNILTMLKSANNPQQMISNLISQNPQLTSLINQYGNGDPKTAFYEYARITGQDPNQVLDALKKLI